MKWQNRIRKKLRLTFVQRLCDLLGSGILNEEDRKRCGDLIKWRGSYGKWNDAQVELVKDLFDRFENGKGYSLYAITDGVRVKLGMSHDVKKRLGNLQTGNPKNWALSGKDLLVLTNKQQE